MLTTDTPPHQCAGCGELLEAVSSPFGPYLPKPGDLTICVYCRVVLIFTADLRHRILTNAEWAALPLQNRQDITRLREHLALCPPPPRVSRRTSQGKDLEGL